MNYSVSIIGSGKVATQICEALYSAGIEILQVYDRHIEKADRLAGKVHCESVSQYHEINSIADLYIIAVSDDAIYEVQASLPPKIKQNRIVVHTSGFTSIHTLDQVVHRGVFYPLNTFTEELKVDFTQTPFFIDSAIEEDLKVLKNIASVLSDKVIVADDNKREQIHVAAVIVSNFSVALLGMGEKIMEEMNLSMDYLRPLLEKTYENCLRYPAAEIITGPASRGDIEVVKKHLRKLDKHPDIKKIYALMSQYISDKL